MGRVVLAGMEFHGRHGVLAEEARLGARFVVDVELHWDFVGIADDIAQAANYAEVYETVRAVVIGPPVQLIEVLAGRIARAVLEDQPLLSGVTVRVHKPHAPIPGIFRDVFAELSLSQEAAPSPAP